MNTKISIKSLINEKTSTMLKKKKKKKTVSKVTTKDKLTKTAQNAEMDLLIENAIYIG